MVKMKPPAGAYGFTARSGNVYGVGAEGVVEVKDDDAAEMRCAGWSIVESEPTPKPASKPKPAPSG